MKAADNAAIEVDRGRAVIDAALNGTDASKWSATPPTFSAPLGDIGTGLELPPLPPATTPGEDLPSDGTVARNTISALVLTLPAGVISHSCWRTKPLAFWIQTIFKGKLTSIDNKLGELKDGFAPNGHKLAAPYADVLGYSDVDVVVSTYKPKFADLKYLALKSMGPRARLPIKIYVEPRDRFCPLFQACFRKKACA